MNRDDLIKGLLDHHGPALRLFAATWSDSPDDCVQRALIKLAASDPLPDQPLAWVYRVIRNEAINCRKNQSRRKRRERIVAERQKLFESRSDSVFSSHELQSALDRLEPDIREIVISKVWGGLTFEQIAEQANCSASAAHRRYQNGLTKLKTELARDTSADMYQRHHE